MKTFVFTLIFATLASCAYTIVSSKQDQAITQEWVNEQHEIQAFQSKQRKERTTTPRIIVVPIDKDWRPSKDKEMAPW